MLFNEECNHEVRCHRHHRYDLHHHVEMASVLAASLLLVQGISSLDSIYNYE
jgi:hypothetical protein